MEAAGLVEKVETPKPLRFNFEDIRKLPPPIIAFNEVAFSYSGKPEDYLYKNLSFGIECVFLFAAAPLWGSSVCAQHGLAHSDRRSKRYGQVNTPEPNHGRTSAVLGHDLASRRS